MSFPRYESCKDSRVEWLGAVPTHWPLFKLKRLATFSGGGTPSRDNLSYWNGEIPWISPKDMKSENILSAEECITEAGLQSSATNLLPAGKLLMVVRSGILKHTIPVAINQVPVALNQDMKALSLRETECLTEFFLRWVQGLNDQLLLAWSKQGATVESIEHTYLAETFIALPPLAEQFAIVAFLDRETAKIDALVDEQQRLIELLKEKRQAVISHAVTKGLDPKAPMKHSGVEWLGEVPEHWDIVRAKTVYRERDERSTDGSEELLSVSHLTGVTPRSEKTVNMFEAETTEGYKKVYKTDFVINTLWAWMGAMGSSKFEGIASPNYHVYALRGDGFSADYMELMCRINSFIRFIGSRSRGVWSSRLRFYPDDFFELMLPAPSLSEQIAIIRFVENTTGAFREITANSERAIALLQERRAALISAAVTGKIDVRGLVPVEAEAA